MNDPGYRAFDGTDWHALVPAYIPPTTDPPMEAKGACGALFTRQGDVADATQDVTCAACVDALEA